MSVYGSGDLKETFPERPAPPGGAGGSAASSLLSPLNTIRIFSFQTLIPFLPELVASSFQARRFYLQVCVLVLHAAVVLQPVYEHTGLRGKGTKQLINISRSSCVDEDCTGFRNLFPT